MSSSIPAGTGGARAACLVSLLMLAPSFDSMAQAPSAVSPEPTGVLVLDEARAAAVHANPELQSLAASVRVREALAAQAGRRPNPVLSTAVENIGVSGRREGFDETETTVLVSQLLETGGKRTRRQDVASSNTELALRDLEIRRLDVLSRTTRAFVAVLVAQRRLMLAEKQERLAGETLQFLARRSAAGAIGPQETTRAQVTVAQGAAGRARAEADLAAARNDLAATWGSPQPRFVRAEGDLEVLPALPSASLLREAAVAVPEVARKASEQQQAEASLALERARRMPDVTLGAGGRHFSDGSEYALVFEVSVPLPIFDRNDDAIAAAHAEVERLQGERTAAELAADAALRQAYQRTQAAVASARRVRSEILPSARVARDQARRAFEQGATSPLDFAHSESLLLEVESTYIDALEAAHLAAADLDRALAMVPTDERHEDRP